MIPLYSCDVLYMVVKIMSESVTESQAIKNGHNLLFFNIVHVQLMYHTQA